jgi:hypothetical protein
MSAKQTGASSCQQLMRNIVAFEGQKSRLWQPTVAAECLFKQKSASKLLMF